MTVVSTLEGQRNAIDTVGNHYSPPPCWGIEHRCGLRNIKKRVYDTIGTTEDRSSFLFTGADMDHLSLQQAQFRDMRVYALVTAGVASNALRMSRDNGGYYEPGTINIIIMGNMQLTPRAMTRAIIAATEAKTAALMDMDIRSSYTPGVHQATGTGTDNMIVVQGAGRKIDNAGGHSKMGELIAKAVYRGVQEAVYHQNGYIPNRNVFQRLKERRISIMGLVDELHCDCGLKKSDLGVALEKALLDPRYAGFIESSFVLSDAYEKGLISDLSAYDGLCRDIAQELAGERPVHIRDRVAPDDIPQVLEKGFNALLTGLYIRMQQP
jgi:adenosylcobinamide amidohydrolase